MVQKTGLDRYGRYSVRSLGEAWLLSIYLTLSNGEWILDGDTPLREFRLLHVVIDAIDDDDPVITRLADHNRILLMRRKYGSCGIVPPYKISYGKLLYDNEGVDQVSWLVERLRAKGETKAATITLHRPGETELSCLSLLDCKLRNGALDMLALYRSQNVFASQPGNLLALRNLQCHIAKEVGATVGLFALYAASAHVYEKDIEQARQVLHLGSSLAPILGFTDQQLESELPQI